MPRANYKNSERWHIAVVITQCSRGAYLVEVDIGDEVEPVIEHWATTTVKGGKRWARRQADCPLHWQEQRLNPGELVFGYALRTNYRARLTVEEQEEHDAEMQAQQEARPLEAELVS